MSVATLAHLLLIGGTTPPFFAVVPWLPAFTTPEASFFRFHDPTKNAPQLPALRAEVALVGRLRPHQFLLPRFRRTENRPKTSLNLPGCYPYPPALPRGHTAAHRGGHGASPARHLSRHVSETKKESRTNWHDSLNKIFGFTFPASVRCAAPAPSEVPSCNPKSSPCARSAWPGRIHAGSTAVPGHLRESYGSHRGRFLNRHA